MLSQFSYRWSHMISLKEVTPNLSQASLKVCYGWVLCKCHGIYDLYSFRYGGLSIAKWFSLVIPLP